MTSGLVYQHMSNHYRRILSAKPAVDTSTPQSFKPRAARKTRRRGSPAPVRASTPVFNSPASSSIEDLALIDRIVASSDYSPSNVCRLQYASTNDKLDEHRFKDISLQRSHFAYSGPKIKMKGPVDIVERHINQFEANHTQFWPMILKTDATSKLREMRIYHPPRRKSTSKWGKKEMEEVVDGCDCTGECHCETHLGEGGKEASQASSRDSAYNGGTCSTPDSRSPTPYQQTTSAHSRHAATQTDPRLRKRSDKRLHRKGASDDFAYTKFIHDITLEVVEKGQFTDKSLSKVITKHVQANTAILNKNRMLEEVQKLRDLLGMPAKDVEQVSQAPFRKPSVSVHEKDSYATTEPESWTTHYKHLSRRRSSKELNGGIVGIDMEKVSNTSESGSVSISEFKRTNSFAIDESIERGSQTTISESVSKSELKRAVSVDVEENIDKISSSLDMVSVGDVEDSDSSREATIKEVVRNNDSSSEEDFDEEIEAGTSASADDDFYS